MIKKINKRKHKALEEQYDHYVCEFCMEIGAKEVIKEFVNDLKEEYEYNTHTHERIYNLIKKWEARSK